MDITQAIVLKDGNLFFLTNADGFVPLESGHGFGLYHNDCRFLDGYELAIDKQKPSVHVIGANAGDQAALELVTIDSVRVQVARAISGKHLALSDRITFSNLTERALQIPLEFFFQAQFDDIFAVRGVPQKKRGSRFQPVWENDTLAFRYAGADEIERCLAIQFSPAPSRVEANTVCYSIELPPKGHCEILISLGILEGHAPLCPPLPGTRQRVSLHREAKASVEISTDNSVLNQILDRSLSDLRMLRSSLDDAEYFAAGVPWYATLFGRDSLIAATQMLAFDPKIADQTIRLLARYQGTQINAWRDEEPGKILHELRVGEMANLHEIPHTPYYGSIDATPLWLMLVGRHAAWTGDLRLFHELRANIEGALRWIGQFGDLDGDGYVEYQCKSEGGLVNQGWKDSGDGIVNADGSLGEPPIALGEVQAYVYQAKIAIASLFRISGEERRATVLENEARILRDRFNRDFWVDDGYFALALQKEKQRLEILSSNAGHALWCGIVDNKRAGQTAQHLLSPKMFSGWGIRTLSADAARYNPLGYHTGSVWPHDNSLIAAGFKRYGFKEAARRVFTALSEAAKCFPLYRLPELFGGTERQDESGPTPYPIACQPQAWAAGAIPFLLTTLLGIEAHAFEKRLRIVQPILPEEVNRVEVRNLLVGEAALDLLFERDQDRIGVMVTDRRGHLDVIVDS
jgi:glycogen debranching enzyme